jgi:hypothetical protein
VVRVALHHRLLFGVDLALALLAAAGFDELRSGRRTWIGISFATVAGAFGAAWLLFASPWTTAGIEQHQLAWTAWGIGAGALLVLLSYLPERRRALLAWVVPIFVVGELAAAHARTNPGLSIDRLYPQTGAVRFVAGKPGRVAATGYTLRPNAAIVYGLDDLRGDDTLRSRAFGRVYDSLAEPSPFYFRPVRNWDSPWLDRLSVRWVIAPPASPPAEGGWALRYDGPDARVFERPSALPVVRWEKGGAPVTIARRVAGAWDLEWASPGSGRLVIAESWDPGWRASLNGRSVRIEQKDGLMMAVTVPPGPARLSLRYVPAGFVPGLVVSLAAIALLVALFRSRVSNDASSVERTAVAP